MPAAKINPASVKGGMISEASDVVHSLHPESMYAQALIFAAILLADRIEKLTDEVMRKGPV